MASHETKKEEAPTGQPAPPKDAPANPSVNVELTDEDLEKVSGGIGSFFPVHSGTPHIPNP